MTARRYLFEPPIDPDLPCEHCGDPLVALAQVHVGSYSIQGLCEYEWSHKHGDKTCRPTTTARPYDGWWATTAVKAAVAVRDADEDALTAAMEDPS